MQARSQLNDYRKGFNNQPLKLLDYFDESTGILNLSHKIYISDDEPLIGVSAKDIPELCKLITNHSGIRTLNLNDTYLGDEVMMPLVEALTQNKYITTLDLSSTRCTDNFVVKLAKGLSQYNTITTLNLSFNRITLSGWKAISKITSLTSLNADMIVIGKESAEVFLAMPNLKFLKMDRNLLSTEAKIVYEQFQKTHAINKMQEFIIKTTLSYDLDDIANLEPEIAINALEAIENIPIKIEDKKYFSKFSISEAIENIQAILAHYSKQDITYETNSDSSAPKDLLNLRTRNDDTALPITKDAVVFYMQHLLKEAVLEQEAKIALTQEEIKLVDKIAEPDLNVSSVDRHNCDVGQMTTTTIDNLSIESANRHDVSIYNQNFNVLDALTTNDNDTNSAVSYDQTDLLNFPTLPKSRFRYWSTPVTPSFSSNYSNAIYISAVLNAGSNLLSSEEMVASPLTHSRLYTEIDTSFKEEIHRYPSWCSFFSYSNQFRLNDAMRYALRSLDGELTVTHLQENFTVTQGREFTIEHADALIYLIKQRYKYVKDALLQVRSLEPHEAKELILDSSIAPFCDI